MKHLYQIALLVFSTSSSVLKSQDTVSVKKFADAIEDNSYLIEEAYNQEKGVVQHISNGYFKTPENDLLFSFTQEWPVTGVKHQLSYTIPYTFSDTGGWGDLMLNYRYQLFYKNKWACIAPRFSIILPTGYIVKGFGMNVIGYQFNLPFSKRLSDSWVIHVNAGTTFYPDVKSEDVSGNEIKNNISFYNFGGSVIWLTRSKVNMMLECLENINSEIDSQGFVIQTNETILNPGLRFAIDVGNLQIVPGLSVPISISENISRVGVFAYLSFEHPF